MCILCVIQKWSRRVATMLPWLVIPLIGLWALSQLLPPPYRFEITSPRLACVFVLLVTLVWYQYLMPCLSAWRVRRTARLREKKRFEALELQKLRKTATRRCRNCLTPYRDQNPGGGKFMCSYCGHISKRPVLDLPIPPGLGISNSSIMKELLGKGGKMLNGRVWSDNSSICRVWLDHGSSVVNGTFPGKFTYSSRRSGSGAGCFGGNEQYLDEKLYPHSHSFPRMWMNAFLKSIRWIWRKLFSVSSSRDDISPDADHRGVSAKRGENGLHYQESRGEKARRKAEEKRQARLEKELLEEEERKQREEVARMVEERRRLRDEKMEAENRARGSCQREKEKKEAEKRRQERKREKDKCSSKSNSDVDEMEKKMGRESEWKRDTDKKMETERREYQRNGTDTVKAQGAETGNGGKVSPVNNFGRGNAGTRYFDRMRGTLLSSSKAFTGGSFFGKSARTPAPATKDRPNSFVDHFHGSVSKRDVCPPDRVPVKLPMNGDERSSNRPVVSEPQHKTAPKSWQQLFTQSPAAPPSTANVIGRPNVKTRPEAQSSQPPSQSSSPPTYDNPINFGFSLPFTLPTFSNGSMNVSSSLAAKDHIFLHAGEVSHDPLPEEPELFEDPCYVPDPVSLLGPVSESLDNFQLDLGTGFMTKEKEKPCSFVNSSAPLDTSRRSPIESPISRVRVSDDKQNHTSRLPCSPRAQDVHPFAAGEFNNVSENGTWQMWNTSPLVQDGLGYLGNNANWVSPLDWSRPYKDDGIHSAPPKTMASLFANDSQPTSGALSPQKIFLGNGQNGSAFGSSMSCQNDDSWLQKAFPASFSLGEDHFPVKPNDDASQKKLVYGCPGRAATNHSFDISQANCWPKSESAIMQGSDECVGNPSVVKPNVGGGLYSTSDVQSLWSFE